MAYDTMSLSGSTPGYEVDRNISLSMPYWAQGELLSVGVRPIFIQVLTNSPSCVKMSLMLTTNSRGCHDGLSP